MSVSSYTSKLGRKWGEIIQVSITRAWEHKHTHLCRRGWFGSICSSFPVFLSLKLRIAGEGLDVKILTMPLGKESVMSPVIFTMHLNTTGHCSILDSDINCIKCYLCIYLHHMDCITVQYWYISLLGMQVLIHIKVCILQYLNQCYFLSHIKKCIEKIL